MEVQALNKALISKNSVLYTTYNGNPFLPKSSSCTCYLNASRILNSLRNSSKESLSLKLRRSKTFYESKRKLNIQITCTIGTGSSFPSDSEPSASLYGKASQFQKAFWKFLRPHTIRGTILGTTAVVVRALIENPQAIDWTLIPRALKGLLALLCGNGYIVGINQIYDSEIDKVNKPFLPVAAGELSKNSAWILCILLSVVGIGIVATHFGKLITVLYSFGLFLGTIYSVPPFRFKRFALPAFLIIATVRGFLLNFGVYYATRAALKLPFQWSPSILFITSFVTVFATVIAITKDLPDVEGDRQFKIDTFASRVGIRFVSFLGSGLLVANYVGAIVAAFTMPQTFRPILMAGVHFVFAVSLILKTYSMDASQYSQESIADYYRSIWNLFYLEYLMFPFI